MATPMTEKSSAIGLDANIAGLLAYLVLPAFIFLLMKEQSKFVRYHSMQSIILWVCSIIVFVVMGVFFHIPFIGWLGLLLMPIIWLVYFLVWLFCMFKAYQGEMFKLPILGDIAEQQANKLA
jgi:uncharacterized membrane protein